MNVLGYTEAGTLVDEPPPDVGAHADWRPEGTVPLELRCAKGLDARFAFALGRLRRRP
jgi:hypothetical protein